MPSFSFLVSVDRMAWYRFQISERCRHAWRVLTMTSRTVAGAFEGAVGRRARSPGGRPWAAMNDDLSAERGGLIGCLRRFCDNAIKTSRLGLMKSARFQPGLELALRLLVLSGAHRQLVFEAMHMRKVAAARPARQRKPGRKNRGIFLGHLRPAAFGSERRGGAVVLFFFDLHVCLVVWG